MSKEKKLRTGKQKRKKKSKPVEEQKNHWRPAKRKRKHERRNQHQVEESSALWSNAGVWWTEADEAAWNKINRAKTSGVTYLELSACTTAAHKDVTVIHEVNLNPDEEKIKAKKKERSGSVLLNLLNKLYV